MSNKANTGWVSVRRATQILEIDKATLFKYRDDGTLKLGPHYAAFPKTRSRDSFKYNISKVKAELKEKGLISI
tara:strand:+ start:9876 stop:10094 length:219 start_codon:yes stop_codon:yes gene_type:complete